MYETGHTGDDSHHNDRHSVYANGPVRLELSDINPASQMNDVLEVVVSITVMSTERITKELKQRQNAGRTDSRCCDNHRNFVADKALETARNGCDQTRRKDDEKN